MARTRAAVRKVTQAARAAALANSEPSVIADGVRAIAVAYEPIVTPGSLYWVAPFRYVVMQMAPRVCRMCQLPPDRAEDVREYLLAAFNEFVVALVEGFDREHFEAWTAAQGAQVAQREGVVLPE